MAKKHKKKQKRDRGVDELLERVKPSGDGLSGDKTNSSAKAESVSTWMGQEYGEEVHTIKQMCMRLREMPVPSSATVTAGYDAESVALALARAHTRLGLLLASWVKEGMPEKDAPVIRMVRADMRVLAEISITMMSQLLEMGGIETVGGTQ